MKEDIDPEEHDEHQFFVPKRARWSQIQKAATNLGDVYKAIIEEVLSDSAAFPTRRCKANNP